jgi:hypothetical protein
MDEVDAEYYAGGLRELAQTMTNSPDRHEVEYFNAAASFIERQQTEIERLRAMLRMSKYTGRKQS